MSVPIIVLREPGAHGVCERWQVSRSQSRPRIDEDPLNPAPNELRVAKGAQYWSHGRAAAAGLNDADLVVTLWRVMNHEPGKSITVVTAIEGRVAQGVDRAAALGAAIAPTLGDAVRAVWAQRVASSKDASRDVGSVHVEVGDTRWRLVNPRPAIPAAALAMIDQLGAEAAPPPPASQTKLDGLTPYKLVEVIWNPSTQSLETRRQAVRLLGVMGKEKRLGDALNTAQRALVEKARDEKELRNDAIQALVLIGPSQDGDTAILTAVKMLTGIPPGVSGETVRALAGQTLEVIKLLVEVGIDPHARNQKGETAAEFAKRLADSESEPRVQEFLKALPRK